MRTEGNHAFLNRAGRLAWTSSLALVACLAAPAMAQDDPGRPDVATKPASLEDIIVTARRVSENLQDVPVAVSAFTGTQLESKNVVQLADVAAFTPGFTTVPSPRNGTSLALSIRGQVQNDVVATIEPSVGTYVDDIYWARAYGLNAGLIDISSIQVLKGPQGTLFGRNTSGGALIVTTNDPDFDGISGRIAGTFGRFNDRSGEAVLNVPLGDVIAIRGAVKFTKRDGWAYEVAPYVNGVRDNTNNPASVIMPTGRKFNDRKEFQARLKALVNISDATQLFLSGEWYQYDTDGPARQMSYKTQFVSPTDNIIAVTPINKYIDYFKDHPNAVGADTHNCDGARTPQPAALCTASIVDSMNMHTLVSTQTFGAKLVTETSFGQAKLIGGYRRVYTDAFFDLDGTSQVMHSTQADIELRQYSIEGQLTGKALGDFLDFAVGTTYFRETGLDRTYSFSNSGGNPTATVSRQNANITNDSFGWYSQVSGHVTDQLTLTGGLRYSIDDKKIELGSAVVNRDGAPLVCFVGGTLATNCVVNDSATFKALSWTASADYKVTDDVLVYAKASRGYRSGGHNLGALNAAQFVPFDPEFVYEQEIGFKGEFFDRRVRLNLSAYRNILKGAQRSALIVTPGTNTTNTLVANAAKARNLGIEGDLQVVPFEGLTLQASGSLNKAKYLEFSDSSGDRRNERFLYVPKYQFSLSGQYATTFSNGMSAQFNVDYSWIDKMASVECVGSGGTLCYDGTANDANGRTPAQINQDIINGTTIPSAGILNARITWGLDDDKYTLAFWGRNLTNNRSMTQALRVPAPFRNYVSVSRRDPVTYGVTASAKF